MPANLPPLAKRSTADDYGFGTVQLDRLSHGCLQRIMKPVRIGSEIKRITLSQPGSRKERLRANASAFAEKLLTRSGFTVAMPKRRPPVTPQHACLADADNCNARH